MSFETIQGSQTCPDGDIAGSAMDVRVACGTEASHLVTRLDASDCIVDPIEENVCGTVVGIAVCVASTMADVGVAVSVKVAMVAEGVAVSMNVVAVGAAAVVVSNGTLVVVGTPNGAVGADRAGPLRGSLPDQRCRRLSLEPDGPEGWEAARLTGGGHKRQLFS